MKSTTNITLNLQLPNYSVAVYAVQGDTMSREIEATLFDGQTPFTPPAGALGTVRYYKPDGTSGFYDTLEDEETVAVTWDDNVATIRLAEQTVTVPGEVLVQLSFYSADAERLSAFTFRLFVEKNPYSDQEFESTDYYSVLTARIAAVLNVTTHAPSINNLGHWVLWDETAQQYYDSGINATGPQGPTGPTGPQGTSIVSTSKASGTGAAGTTDVYNVNLSNGTVAGTFNVYQGQDGQGSPGSATPLMDGTASAGSANAYSREDHVHPKDTSKLDTSAFVLSNTTPPSDGAGSPGVLTEVARSDHQHPSDATKQDANDEGDGYFKSADGTLIQWGIIAVTTEGNATRGFPTQNPNVDVYRGVDTVNFDEEFYSTPSVYAGGDNELYGIFSAHEITTEGFVVEGFHNARTTINISWIAIGRWKA